MAKLEAVKDEEVAVAEEVTDAEAVEALGEFFSQASTTVAAVEEEEKPAEIFGEVGHDAPAESDEEDLGIEIWVPEQVKFLKMLVYGDSGVGKTVFGSTAPKPIFAQAEFGMTSVVVPGVAYKKIVTWDDLRLLLRYLMRGNHPYETLVVDSLNEVQKIAMDNVLTKFEPGVNGTSKRVYDNQPNVSDWGKALNDLLRFIRTLRTLPMNVILLATTSGQKSSEDRVEPALSGKSMVNDVCRYMDIVGHMAVDEDESGTGTIRRIGFDVANGVSKDRTRKLPSVLHNPTWPEMAKYWQ